jgi:glycosyltransferase involved in cell wall biosynthesis
MVWALRQCTGIICVARALQELALAQDIPGEKIRVIPNAVDRQTYRPSPQGEARRLLGISGGERFIVAVGMLVQGKGHHILVRAFSRLLEKHRDLRLVLIGGETHEPRYPRELRKLIGELGLADRAVLAGSQSPQRVVTWLQAADLFALPTFDEGCCNAILEAMACGLPVVTTPVGDNAALIDPPRRGLLAPVKNADALAEVLEAALSQSWDRGEIARHGAEYTWDEVANQTGDFFRERLGIPRTGQGRQRPPSWSREQELLHAPDGLKATFP